MTLPASGQIAMSDVNTEIRRTATAQLELNDATVRYVFQRPVNLSQIAMSDGRGRTYAFQFTITIASNTANFNLRNSAVAAGWDQVIPLNANITINGGVVVYGTSTGTPAFACGGGYPAQTSITITNNGYIWGEGGAGGAGGAAVPGAGYGGGAGGAGGPALNTSYYINLYNNAYIFAGGGGGGGCGGMAWLANNWGTASGSGGGGGNSWAGSPGGGRGSSGGGTYTFYGNAGGAGGGGGAGAGGAGYGAIYVYSGQYGATGNGSFGMGAGGAGGAAGAAGAGGGGGGSVNNGGAAPTFAGPYNGGGGGGGAPGYAIQGNGYISWYAGNNGSQVRGYYA